MKVSAKLKNLRIAPRKVGLVAKLIRGLDAEDALNQLEVHIKKSSPYIKKLLKSAISNAENNFGIDKDNMYVSDVTVGAGPMLKRWMPKAYGRAGMIHKRTSTIEIIIDERIEGKGRKSQEQLDKERKERLEKKRKLEKEAREKTEDQKTEKEKEFEPADMTEKDNKKSGGSGKWGSKIFRRKSM